MGNTRHELSGMYYFYVSCTAAFGSFKALGQPQRAQSGRAPEFDNSLLLIASSKTVLYLIKICLCQIFHQWYIENYKTRSTDRIKANCEYCPHLYSVTPAYIYRSVFHRVCKSENTKIQYTSATLATSVL